MGAHTLATRSYAVRSNAKDKAGDAGIEVVNLKQEIENINVKIEKLEVDKRKWEAKADAAEKSGNKEEAEKHLDRYDVVNSQLSSLQQQLPSLQERLNRKESSLFGILDKTKGELAEERAKKPSPPERRPLDLSSLDSVEDVKPPPILPNEPPFTADGPWLESVCEEIMYYFGASDGGRRVAPMALVRCSRGGKTRALFEIAHALKVPVLMVSFNDYSSVPALDKNHSVLDEDRSDPVGALCRRIAFVATKNRDFNFGIAQHDYKEFHRDVGVTEDQILKWLGTKPCVLLIDELNNVPQSSQLATFLKVNFVGKPNRYLVFSSHVVSTTTELANYMDTSSSRQVLVRPLPLIPSLEVARKNFSWAALNAREALYYGKIPALINEARFDLPSTKRNQAIRECVDGELVSKDSLRALLSTFITGNSNNVMKPLLQLMNTPKDAVVQWIPYHMMHVLERFSDRKHTHIDDRHIIRKIPELFSGFFEAKEGSGDAWERLFVIVLIIRLYSRQVETKILPPRLEDNYSLSYDEPFDPAKNFDTPYVEEFVEGIGSPESYPHVGIYFPSHSSFELYDVILVHFISASVKKIYGYQMKEGKALPKEPASDMFEKSWVIRGQAAATSSSGNEWDRPSKEDITTFFGKSGQLWTPDEWARLRDQ